MLTCMHYTHREEISIAVQPQYLYLDGVRWLRIDVRQGVRVYTIA